MTLTVEGEDRDATWKQGVGIYVDGHDFGNADTVEIGGTAHKVNGQAPDADAWRDGDADRGGKGVVGKSGAADSFSDHRWC